MSRFISERLSSLKAYVPGEQPQDKKYIKLNTNESPFPPSEEVVKAAEAEARRLELYPDPECRELKKALADRYEVRPENVMIANGSDEALNFSFMAFAGDRYPVAYPDVSYGFYRVFADLYKLDRIEIPLKADLSIDIETFKAQKGMVVIANPNAPTGISLSKEEIEEIVKSDTERIVLIDEAYVDFGGESVIPLIKRYDNLIVMQTYSKARSMAGARLGYAIASEEIIADLETVRNSTNPYNINRMTLAAGLAMLKNDRLAMENCRKIAEIREEVKGSLKELGCKVTDSRANFLFAKPPVGSGEDWYKELKKRGVLVRWLKGERTAPYIRVSIGNREQMDTFLRESREYFTEAGR
ncbi:MAG: histidinol-phosphate transaminase [Clostridia bacterium]|nr:histidinol-phosphate transaminase [Clostridia bacterium]MBQ5957333.1 histidinol-phosphate transaminase [Clostridia bacterium]